MTFLFLILGLQNLGGWWWHFTEVILMTEVLQTVSRKCIFSEANSRWSYSYFLFLNPNDRGWDGWMASRTQWTWVWVDSRSWWWTGRPGVLQFMGSQRVRHDWVTELNWMFWGFPCASAGKESTCNTEDLGLILWRRERLPTPVFWPGEFPVHVFTTRRTQLTDFHFTNSFICSCCYT